MSYLRDQFPILSDSAYFDVALMAPTSINLVEMYHEYFNQLLTGPGNKDKWYQKITSIRKNIAALINAKPREIAFVKNTSEGINLLAHSIEYKPGDNVIISDQEHVTNVYPWTNLSRLGVHVREIRSRNFYYDVEDIREITDEHTRVISITTVCPRSGFRPDLVKISQFCEDNKIYFFLDAIQSLGALEMDVERLKIDALATSGHKWLLGPYGTGFLFCREELIPELKPIFASKLYISDAHDMDNTSKYVDARRWEYGSLNYPGILALGTGLDMIRSIGTRNVEEHISKLVTTLRQKIQDFGLEVVTPITDGNISGILCFRVDNPESVIKNLNDERIFVSKRDKNIRVSIHFYNNEDDLDHLMTILKKIL